MIIPAPQPVAFSLSGLPVYWYGICMACAIFIAIICANAMFNRQNDFLKKDIIVSFAPVVIICGILGARLYFCFLNPVYYFAHPVEILDIRQGGLSIHGALIAGIASLWVLAHKNKIPVLNILDAMGCATILGQAIGRWGNYFNSEAYGLPVSSQRWGLFIPPERRVGQYYDYSLFHPAFLYESILDLCGFFLLLFIYFKYSKKYSGLPFFTYLTLYSVIRFFIEQIRVDSALNLGGIPVAQLVSVICFLTGLCGITVALFKNSKPARQNTSNDGLNSKF